MQFEEVLDAAREMLQRRGRVTLRAIKRQFDLSDDYLEDLKEELIFGQRVAKEEDGKVLVWVGDDSEPRSSTPDAKSPPQPAAVADATSEHADGHAEYRHLTVEFCDLVGSTELSARLDPEDYREVTAAYHAASSNVIERYDGHVAQYLGDGLLVYCGYPLAHEDDPHRAILIGLGIVEALSRLNPEIEARSGARLAVRIGIHTGSVIVGQVGSGGRQEDLALGEAPNIAARLQGIAEPDMIVISEATRQLIGSSYDLVELGEQTLKGINVPVRAYAVKGVSSSSASRFEAATGMGTVPVVARTEELALLTERWNEVVEGEGQTILLRGEPGIGKSRLLQEFTDRLEGQPFARLIYQCLSYGTNTLLHPFMAEIERAAGVAPDETATVKLDKLEAWLAGHGAVDPVTRRLFAELLAIPVGDRYPPLAMSPQRQKDRTIEALAKRIEWLASESPVVLVFEDAHWADPTTIEALGRLSQALQQARVLLIVTYRPSEFTPPRSWEAQARLSVHTLSRLARRHVVTLVDRVTDKPLPPEVVDHIADKTDGVPLFIEELTKAILESGILSDAGDRYTLAGPLPTMTVPSTLQDTLMARLDRLAPVKLVAQTGAAIGREFDYELIEILKPLPTSELDQALEQLVDSGLVLRPGTGTYRFKHALVQDTAYGSMLRKTRQQLHARIANALEQHFSEMVASTPELLAHHHTMADNIAVAIAYWRRAGQKAVRIGALEQALAHLKTGLDLARTLSDSEERSRQEYALHKELGLTYMLQLGWHAAPVAEHLGLAAELGSGIGEVESLYPVTYGLWINHLNRGNFPEARAWLDTLSNDTEAAGSSDGRLMAHSAGAIHSGFLGEYAKVGEHRRQVGALYDPERHRDFVYTLGNDPKVVSLGFWSWAAWILGDHAEAERARIEAETYARALGHAPDLAWQLTIGSLTLFFNRDVEGWTRRVAEVVALAEAQGITFLQLVFGPIFTGFSDSMAGDWTAAASRIEQGLGVWESVGGGVAIPLWKSQIGHAHCNNGDFDEGLRWISEACDQARKGEHWFEPETHRLRGHWLLHKTEPDPAGAESAYQQSLEIARGLGANSWELRTTLSLSRLWLQQDRVREAEDALRSISDKFTGDPATPDVADVRTLLGEL